MPIPVTADVFAAQVVLTGQTGRPEDVYVNTFYFRNDTGLGTAEQFADIVADDVHAFYENVPDQEVGLHSVASRLAQQVVTPDLTIKVYDLGQPSPRYPMTRARTITGMSQPALPSEAAICLSYVSERNQPRFRGRVYLGPLSSVAGIVANGRVVVRPETQKSILYSYATLLESTAHHPMLWSPTDAAFKPITGAWVDNAFDTQRRRGEVAFERFTMGDYLGEKGTKLTLTP